MDVKILSHPDRKLIDHLNEVKRKALEKFEKISQYIEWEKTFGYKKEDVKKVLEIAAFYHDIGKATDAFQKKIRGEKGFGGVKHAPVSSLLVAKILYEKGFDDFLVFCGYSVVRYHHGRLKSPLEEFINLDEVKKLWKTIPTEFLKEVEAPSDIDFDELEEVLEEIELDVENVGEEGYFLLKLLFSILTSSDREDVVFRDRNDLKMEMIMEEDVEKYVNSLKRKSWIDDLRRAFHNEVASFSKSEPIVTVRAPTGIGKTLANIRLALKLKKSPESVIVYSLPFINIIEQTADVFRKVFGDKKVMESHHLSEDATEIKEEYSESDLKRLRELNIIYETWQAPLVVTTFVSLLEALIGGSKAPFLHRLVGGVIILDEIQAVPYEKWGVVKKVFDFLPKMGISVVFSTATMPVIFTGKSAVRGNYSEKLNRYKVYVEDEHSEDEFKARVKEIVSDGKSTLVILNTIEDAENLWKEFEENACYLSSRVLPVEREKRIKEIKEGKWKICISTQVVEAGVDISFERVIRDIAPLDSIVQAAGRCNRSFEKDMGEVIVIPLKKDKRFPARNVYGNYLIDKTLEVLRNSQEFEEKDLQEIVEKYFENLTKLGDIDKERFVEALQKLDISKLNEFKLIKDQTSVSFILLKDEYAENIFEKLEKAAEKHSGIEKSIIISAYLRKLSPYILTTPVYKLEKERMSAFETKFGFAVIRKDNLENWYHPVLGLQLKKGGGGIFI